MRGMKFVVSGAFLVALAGCATTDGNSMSSKQSGFDDDVDWQKVAFINRDARMRGYDIVWINPPQKKKPAGGNR